MSDANFAALLSFLSSVITLYVMNRKQNAIKDTQETMKSDIESVKEHTNSLTTMAVDASRIAGYGEGMAQERTDETARQVARDVS